MRVIAIISDKSKATQNPLSYSGKYQLPTRSGSSVRETNVSVAGDVR